jgi:hypothetical protein
MAEVFKYFSLLICALLSFGLVRIVYRLTLHPLAKFSGPKLAAATSLFQAWYDLRPSTSYVKEFPGYHKKYGQSYQRQYHPSKSLTQSGPIVRIRPNQLHVFDIKAYKE